MNKNKENSDGLSLFVDKLYTAIDRLISRANFDRTSIGQVTEIGDDNTYTVAVFGGNFKLHYREKLKIGDVVRVKIPQNIWKDMYIESVA